MKKKLHRAKLEKFKRNGTYIDDYTDPEDLKVYSNAERANRADALPERIGVIAEPIQPIVQPVEEPTVEPVQSVAQPVEETKQEAPIHSPRFVRGIISRREGGGGVRQTVAKTKF